MIKRWESERALHVCRGRAGTPGRQSVQKSWGSSSMFQGEKCGWTRVREGQLGGGEVKVSIPNRHFVPRWGHCFLCKCAVTQWCPTLCDPVDCSLPGSSVHEILQAEILERVLFPSPEDLLTQDQTQISCITGRFLYHLSHQRLY